MRGYRRVVPDFARWQTDLEPPGEVRVDARAAAGGAQGLFRQECDVGAIGAPSNDSPDDRLVTTLAMFCPFEPQEKQALLEAETLAERAATLIALLEMGAVCGSPGEPAKH